MGDRGNIVVQESTGKRVYFYTHWEGSEIEGTVKTALKRRERWNDAPYLARIIFCTLVAGDYEGELGYGISTGMVDNEHPILVVDVENQRVHFENEQGVWDGETRKTFEEFIA